MQLSTATCLCLTWNDGGRLVCTLSQACLGTGGWTQAGTLRSIIGPSVCPMALRGSCVTAPFRPYVFSSRTYAFSSRMWSHRRYTVKYRTMARG